MGDEVVGQPVARPPRFGSWVSGFHHHAWRVWAMACGSNTHTCPTRSRAAVVVVHTSGLLEVASTAPGASSIAGAVRAVVLPARGAITAMTTSSIDAYSTSPPRRPRPNRPRVWWRAQRHPGLPGPNQCRGGGGQRRAQPPRLRHYLRQGQAANRPRVGQRRQRVFPVGAVDLPPRPHRPQRRRTWRPSARHRRRTPGRRQAGPQHAPSHRRSRPTRNGASKSGPAGVPATPATMPPGGPGQPHRRDHRPDQTDAPATRSAAHRPCRAAHRASEHDNLQCTPRGRPIGKGLR